MSLYCIVISYYQLSRSHVILNIGVLSMCYDKFTYQIWSLYPTHSKDNERWYKMLKTGWFKVVRGQTKSLEIEIGYNTCNFLLVCLISNYVPILHRFWDVGLARYWSKTADFNPPLYLAPAPLGSDPIGISPRSLAPEDR